MLHSIGRKGQFGLIGGSRLGSHSTPYSLERMGGEEGTKPPRWLSRPWILQFQSSNSTGKVKTSLHLLHQMLMKLRSLVVMVMFLCSMMSLTILRMSGHLHWLRRARTSSLLTMFSPWPFGLTGRGRIGLYSAPG